MFVFPCSLVLWRTWQFPRYALISLLKNHFKISFVQTSDDFNTPDVIKDMEGGATILTATVEWNKKTPQPWKLKTSGRKIDFCCIPYKISSHKLIKLSWCYNGGISDFQISHQFLIKGNCHYSRASDGIDMTLGPATKLDERNKKKNVKKIWRWLHVGKSWLHCHFYNLRPIWRNPKARFQTYSL